MSNWAKLSNLGDLLLIMSESLVGSRHLASTAVDESRHLSRRQRRPMGVVVRVCARFHLPPMHGHPFAILFAGALCPHALDHLGETTLRIAQTRLNRHKFRRLLLSTLNGTDIASNVIDSIRRVLERLQQRGKFGLGGDHPTIVPHFCA